MGDRENSQSRGVNISGGIVSFTGDLEGEDKITSTVSTTHPKERPYNKVPDITPEFLNQGDWSQEKEDQLKTLEASELNHPVGEKTIVTETNEKGTYITIFSDEEIPSKNFSESRRSGKCKNCGASLSDNPYRSTCEYCKKDIDQETFRRKQRNDFIPHKEETTVSEVSKRKETPSNVESQVRDLVKSEKKGSGINNSAKGGACTELVITSAIGYSIKDVIVLDRCSIKSSQKVRGKIFVPPSFEGIDETESQNNSVDTEIVSWEWILEHIKPKA